MPFCPFDLLFVTQDCRMSKVWCGVTSMPAVVHNPSVSGAAPAMIGCIALPIST